MVVKIFICVQRSEQRQKGRSRLAEIMALQIPPACAAARSLQLPSADGDRDRFCLMRATILSTVTQSSRNSRCLPRFYGKGVDTPLSFSFVFHFPGT